MVVKSFIEEVVTTPGAEKIYECIQCGICTGSCPASVMGYSPRKIIAMVRAGLRNEVLSDSSICYCVSCYTQKDLVTGTDVPLMFRSFVNSIKENGRVHELGMMLRFFLGAGHAPIKLLPVALDLLGYGRISLKPHRTKGVQELKRIQDKFAEIRGIQ